MTLVVGVTLSSSEEIFLVDNKNLIATNYQNLELYNLNM